MRPISRCGFARGTGITAIRRNRVQELLPTIRIPLILRALRVCFGIPGVFLRRIKLVLVVIHSPPPEYLGMCLSSLYSDSFSKSNSIPDSSHCITSVLVKAVQYSVVDGLEQISICIRHRVITGKSIIPAYYHVLIRHIQCGSVALGHRIFSRATILSLTVPV